MSEKDRVKNSKIWACQRLPKIVKDSNWVARKFRG
jgi:hypothetical protein